MKWPELKLHKHLLEIDPQDAAAIADGCVVSSETKRRCGNHLKHVFENATSGQLYKKYERALETWVADDCQTHAKLQSPPWPVGCAWWVTRGSFNVEKTRITFIAYY